MKIKPGVQIRGLTPQAVLAMVIAHTTAKDLGLELTITSGSEGKHSHTSLHYAGNAFDLRSRSWSNEQVDGFVRHLRYNLGDKNYDVVREETHIHVEYQPKGQAQ